MSIELEEKQGEYPSDKISIVNNDISLNGIDTVTFDNGNYITCTVSSQNSYSSGYTKYINSYTCSTYAANGRVVRQVVETKINDVKQGSSLQSSVENSLLKIGNSAVLVKGLQYYYSGSYYDSSFYKICSIIRFFNQDGIMIANRDYDTGEMNFGSTNFRSVMYSYYTAQDPIEFYKFGNNLLFHAGFLRITSTTRSENTPFKIFSITKGFNSAGNEIASTGIDKTYSLPSEINSGSMLKIQSKFLGNDNSFFLVFVSYAYNVGLSVNYFIESYSYNQNFNRGKTTSVEKTLTSIYGGIDANVIPLSLDDDGRNVYIKGGRSNKGFEAYFSELIFSYPAPSAAPTLNPSRSPSVHPSKKPSLIPSASPSVEPSADPSVPPTASPSTAPTAAPTASPTTSPSVEPSSPPSVLPSAAPTTDPTFLPSIEPTVLPTVPPTTSPIAAPTVVSTVSPTHPCHPLISAQITALSNLKAKEASKGDYIKLELAIDNNNYCTTFENGLNEGKFTNINYTFTCKESFKLRALEGDSSDNKIVDSFKLINSAEETCLIDKDLNNFISLKGQGAEYLINYQLTLKNHPTEADTECNKTSNPESKIEFRSDICKKGPLLKPPIHIDTNGDRKEDWICEYIDGTIDVCNSDGSTELKCELLQIANNYEVKYEFGS